MLRAVCRGLTIALTFLLLIGVLVDVFAQACGRGRSEPSQPRISIRGEVDSSAKVAHVQSAR